MKPTNEIQNKINELKVEKEDWLMKQKNYKFTEKEKIEGSFLYGRYQDGETNCDDKIKLLEWVLNN